MGWASYLEMRPLPSTSMDPQRYSYIYRNLNWDGDHIFIPTKVEDRVSSFSGIADYRAKGKDVWGSGWDVTIDRLRGYAKIFEQIGKSFEQASVSEALSSKNELDGILEGLNRDVCSKCSFYSKCWERGFYHTYQNMYLLLDKIEKNNAIQQEDLDQLTKGCLHPAGLPRVNMPV